jgi:hypothetical protein
MAGAVMSTIAGEHTAEGFVTIKLGNSFTEKKKSTVQPLLFLYVIVVVPGAILDTSPVLLTVAVEGFDDIHGELVLAVAEPINCEVVPMHPFEGPDIVGRLFTVKVVFTVQPSEFVKLIVVVPAVSVFINPVLSIVAIVGFEDAHGELEAEVPEPINCEVELVQTEKVPVIVGKVFTVKVEVATQLLEFL